MAHSAQEVRNKKRSSAASLFKTNPLKLQNTSGAGPLATGFSPPEDASPPVPPLPHPASAKKKKPIVGKPLESPYGKKVQPPTRGMAAALRLEPTTPPPVLAAAAAAPKTRPHEEDFAAFDTALMLHMDAFESALKSKKNDENPSPAGKTLPSTASLEALILYGNQVASASPRSPGQDITPIATPSP